MKKKFLINLIVSLVSFTTFAQSHYEEILRYPNGKIKAVITYKDNDIKDGNSLYYYQNTAIRSFVPYIDGKVNGIVENYYENGNLESIGQVLNDLQEGVFIYYHRNGNPKSTIEYKNGKLINVSKCYDRKKNILYCGPFNNGNGEIYIYNEDSKLISKDHFKDGIFIKNQLQN